MTVGQEVSSCLLGQRKAVELMRWVFSSEHRSIPTQLQCSPFLNIIPAATSVSALPHSLNVIALRQWAPSFLNRVAGSTVCMWLKPLQTERKSRLWLWMLRKDFCLFLSLPPLSISYSFHSLKDNSHSVTITEAGHRMKLRSGKAGMRDEKKFCPWFWAPWSNQPCILSHLWALWLHGSIIYCLT